MKTVTDEQLTGSQTLQKLTVLSRVSPINVDDPAEVKSALASSLLVLIDAIDNDKIHCADREDKDALWQLMFVTHQIITQIRPASSVRN